MRWPSPFRPRYRRWWLAFVASVALHTAFLAVVRPGATDARPPRAPAIDSRVDGPLTLHLVEPPEIVAMAILERLRGDAASGERLLVEA